MAGNAQIQENDTVAVWGCGPVGQFAIASAFMLGAARVIAIDRIPKRLEMARSIGAITIDYSGEEGSVLTGLKDPTGGIGPDSRIDAVGLEAQSAQLQGIYDKVKTTLMLAPLDANRGSKKYILDIASLGVRIITTRLGRPSAADSVVSAAGAPRSFPNANCTNRATL